MRVGAWMLVGTLLTGGAAFAGEPEPCATCGDGCKVCVPVVKMKKVPHVEYDCKCEDVCVPYILPPALRAWLFGKHGDGCSACGRPIVVKKLVKFTDQREEPEVKCEVRPAGCCAGACPP